MSAMRVRFVGLTWAAALTAFLVPGCGRLTQTEPTAVHKVDVESHRQQFEAAIALGDGPGSAGERAAVAYVKNAFSAMGFETVVQDVPLISMTTTTSRLRLNGPKRSYTVDPDGKDYVVWPGRQEPHAAFDKVPVVFAGYGIVAPEFQRNDYKNVDVSGRVVVLLEGTPKAGGREEMGEQGTNYYGRRFYKYAEAGRRGALAVLLIHAEREPWAVIQQELGQGIMEVAASAQLVRRSAPAIEGLIRREAAVMLFGAAGVDLVQAALRANELAFTPFQIGPLTLDAELVTSLTPKTAHSVFGVLKGKDQASVLLTSRWNRHELGAVAQGRIAARKAGVRGRARVPVSLQEPENGAALILEVAREMVARNRHPQRSMVFGVLTATVDGVPGLAYYTDHPLLPMDKLVGHVFLDSGSTPGLLTQIGKVGLTGDSALQQFAREAAILQGRLMVPDEDPARSFYYRATQFELLQRAVPSLFLTYSPENQRRARLRPVEDGRVRELSSHDAAIGDVRITADLVERLSGVTLWRPRTQARGATP